MNDVSTVEEAREWFAANTDPVRCIARPTVRKVCNTLKEAEEFYEMMGKGAGNENAIITFMHCGLCLQEKPVGVSPREWSRLDFGWTPFGVQVWCRRHECNVIHLDFEGHKHPADTTRKRPAGSS